MPIEFRCTNCNKLLRTADDTAGKQAKCPQCGTVVDIPQNSTAPSSFGEPLGGLPSPGLPGSREPLGAAPFGPAPGVNPYQSPLMASDPFAAPRAPRSGPPWERDGASIGSFFESVKLMFTQLPFFFMDMRREGGIGAPMGFGVIGGMIGVLAAMLMQFALQGILGAAVGGGGQQIGAMLGGGAIGMGLVAVCAPVGLILGMLLNSAIYHVTLMLLGGANQPFETTFRVVAYSMGCTSLLMLIPICGQYVNGIVQIVFCIFGLMHAHETTGWKATGAVLIPVLVCACLAIGLIALVFGSIFAAAQNGGMQ